MNPSAPDWIPKLISQFGEVLKGEKFLTQDQLYHRLIEVGFIYGVSSQTLLNQRISHLNLTKEEITKVNLFLALVLTYFHQNSKHTYKDAIDTCIRYYVYLEKDKKGFLQKLTIGPSQSQKLEQILSARLHDKNSVLKHNAVSILTFALLYTDILTFKFWLENDFKAKRYFESFEALVVSMCLKALESKNNKNKYDILLIEMFKSSTEYHTSKKDISESLTQNLSVVNETYSKLEKKYLLDICCLAVWDDRKMDDHEHSFLVNIAKDLGFDSSEVADSLSKLGAFSEKYGAKIKLFEYSNPVKSFYKQSTATVKLLILRNKNRLIQELEESGELLVLLTQSSVRELNKVEKQKVKEQLLDICKTIPSLTIFLLPGGTVLLPLLVKLIPKLLPSAFNENKID